MNNCLSLILIANFALAQTTAKVQVKTNGFNKIVISPELRALSKADLSDFRIFDSKNQEIPYVKIEENDNIQHYDFEEYPILGRMADEKDSTAMVVENPMKEINSLTLFIANTSVNKTYNLYGSNDHKSWFGIAEKQKLEDLSESSNSYVMKTIAFPRCTYRFLRIVFNNKKTLPINVLHIGNLKPAAKNGIGLLPAVPDYSTVSNIQGSKKTVIEVRYKNPTMINKMVFHISGQRYYNRKVNVYKNVTVTRKRKKQVIREDLMQFDLTSYSNNIFPLEINEKSFFMEIENGDDAQLQINDTEYLQIPIIIAADLKSNENYTIKTGNSNLKAPRYDLSYFRDSIPKNLPEVAISDIQTQSPERQPPSPKPFWQSQWFLWTCIAIGGIVLLLFTRSLMKDMNRNQ